MGRNVESGSDSLLDIRMDWEDGYESICIYCDEVVKTDYSFPAQWLDHKGSNECAEDERGHFSFEYDSDNWENDLEYYQGWLIEMFPSLIEADSFNTSNGYLRESRVIARNNLVEVRVSEYSGVTNLSFAPTEDAPLGLTQHWVKQIAPRLKDWNNA